MAGEERELTNRPSPPAREASEFSGIKSRGRPATNAGRPGVTNDEEDQSVKKSALIPCGDANIAALS